MIYFLWSVLNLAALVWFLFICFGALKLIRENFGLASTIIFVVSCLSFIKGGVANKQEELLIDPEVKGQTLVTENIQKELFFNLDLHYIYSKDSLAKEIRTVTVKNGLVIGHGWNNVLIHADIKSGALHYKVKGMHDWQLLGLTLYSMPEELQGIVKMK